MEQVETGARLCRPRPAAARGKLPTPSSFPPAAAGLRHSRAPFQWRGEGIKGGSRVSGNASSTVAKIPAPRQERGCVVLDQPQHAASSQRLRTSRPLRLVFDTAALRSKWSGEGIKGEGPCFFHRLRKFLHRVRMSVAIVSTNDMANSLEGCPWDVRRPDGDGR